MAGPNAAARAPGACLRPEPESWRLKECGRGSGGRSPDGCDLSSIAPAAAASGAADLKCHQGCFTLHAAAEMPCGSCSAGPCCTAMPWERHGGGSAPNRLRPAPGRGERRSGALPWLPLGWPLLLPICTACSAPRGVLTAGDGVAATEDAGESSVSRSKMLVGDGTAALALRGVCLGALLLVMAAVRCRRAKLRRQHACSRHLSCARLSTGAAVKCESFQTQMLSEEKALTGTCSNARAETLPPAGCPHGPHVSYFDGHAGELCRRGWLNLPQNGSKQLCGCTHGPVANEITRTSGAPGWKLLGSHFAARQMFFKENCVSKVQNITLIVHSRERRGISVLHSHIDLWMHYCTRDDHSDRELWSDTVTEPVSTDSVSTTPHSASGAVF